MKILIIGSTTGYHETGPKDLEYCKELGKILAEFSNKYNINTEVITGGTFGFPSKFAEGFIENSENIVKFIIPKNFYKEINLNQPGIIYETHGETMEERRKYLTNIKDITYVIVFGGGPGTIDEIEHLNKREEIKEIIYYPRQGGACLSKKDRLKIFQESGDYEVPEYYLNSVFADKMANLEQISEYFKTILEILMKQEKQDMYTPLIFWLTKDEGAFYPIFEEKNF